MPSAPVNPNTLTDYARQAGLSCAVLADLVFECATEKVMRRKGRKERVAFETDMMWGAHEVNLRGYFSQLTYLCDFYGAAEVANMLALAAGDHNAKASSDR